MEDLKSNTKRRIYMNLDKTRDHEFIGKDYEEFWKLVCKYRSKIIDSFFSRMGDEDLDGEREMKERIVEEFKKASTEKKERHLFIALRIMAHPYKPTIGKCNSEAATRLTAYLSGLGVELVDALVGMR